MADLNGIFEAIKRTINGVPDSGSVTYGQQIEDRGWREPLMLNGEIRGWIVTPVASATSSPAVGRSLQQINWRVYHLAQVAADAGASRRAFDNRLQAVRRAFLANGTLGGAVVQCAPEGSRLTGLQIHSADEVMVHRVALHMADSTLVTLSVDMPARDWPARDRSAERAEETDQPKIGGQ